MLGDTIVSLDFDMKTVKPGLAESWTDLARRQDLHVQDPQ